METPQQYTQRIVSHTAGQEPLKIQAATPKKIRRLLGRATTSKLRKRPAPGKWSIDVYKRQSLRRSLLRADKFYPTGERSGPASPASATVGHQSSPSPQTSFGGFVSPAASDKKDNERA